MEPRGLRFLDLWFGPPDFIQLVMVVFKHIPTVASYSINSFDELASYVKFEKSFGIVHLFSKLLSFMYGTKRVRGGPPDKLMFLHL